VGIGVAEGTFYKEHLVPFGEYVPFEGLLRGLIGFFNLPMSSFVPGPSDQQPLVAFGYRFVPAICYEIAYPIFIQQMSKNAEFILTVSNDTWFGDSIGPQQHLQIAQFRGLETGMYVIRATNTGITGILNPDNEVEDAEYAKQFEEIVYTGTVKVMAGQTWWVQYGILTLLILLPLPILGAFYIRSKYKP
jgi:apolipoprotein N-acyltransferase